MVHFASALLEIIFISETNRSISRKVLTKTLVCLFVRSFVFVKFWPIKINSEDFEILSAFSHHPKCLI